jgi:flagellar protein FliO/FliZ
MFTHLRVSGGILSLFVFLFLFTGQVLAAAETGEYLKYQEPQPASTSWLATSGYIISLLLTFLLVLGLAYLTSRFLGKRMISGGGLGNGKVYTSLSLGPNRAVYVIEIAGKFMVLGVTEQNITLLTEINSLADIEQLKAIENIGMPPEQFSSVFHRQLGLLRQMQKKFPYTFSSDTPEFPEKEHETGSRKR